MLNLTFLLFEFERRTKYKVFGDLTNTIMSHWIQKHFRKIAALGSGIGIAGGSQYFPKIGLAYFSSLRIKCLFSESVLEDEVSLVASDFMDAFKADLKTEMQKEIQKFGKLIVSGSVPLNEKVITEEIEKEAMIVGKDLAAAFRRDLNNAIEKEVMRLTRRLLHDHK